MTSIKSGTIDAKKQGWKWLKMKTKNKKHSIIKINCLFPHLNTKKNITLIKVRSFKPTEGAFLIPL